jgi:serine phosphatase RsbU (regulator of sigma subunit)
MSEQLETRVRTSPTASLPSDDGIWSLATALAGAVAPSEVAAALAEQGAAAAGASFSNMAVLNVETGMVRVVHGSVMDTTIAARWEEFALSEPTPLCEAMVSRRAVLVASLDELGRRYPDLVADTAAASIGATASYPLFSAAGLVLGAVGFGWPTAQGFGSEQVRTLDLVANLAAQALERAVLTQRENERASTRERADAQLLQDAFLPRSLPTTDSLDLAAVYLPASDAAMGGDWYDVFPVTGGTCLVIGDVVGHGVQSAAVMGQLRNTVRAYAVEDPSPARVLTRLNRMMCRLQPGEYATAIVAVWDEERGTLLRCNAGHPPVLRCRPGEFEFLAPAPGGRLLGVSPDWVYQERLKVLRPGTTMLFYTDGLVERRGQELHDGMRAFREFVEGLDDLSPAAICDQALQWRRTQGRLEDDVCLLAARLK